MKPFDLEKALAGEPVRLRNGNKAFILHKLDKASRDHLLGYFVDKTNGDVPCRWDLSGNGDIHLRDIIGMWQEPSRIINGIEVPPCLAFDEWESGAGYYVVYLEGNGFVDYRRLHKHYPWECNLVNRGLAFKTKEGAIAMAKALLNYEVEE
ncbi:hypothetical protein KRX11_04485 [Pasteurellaceae bacterium TAE3-ERU1]|nr:hypothetical protein [Pasteurellaceae bacterium TAE3-ERU1]